MKDLSFSLLLKSGATKEQLMKHFCLNEKQYNKVLASLESIRKGERI